MVELVKMEDEALRVMTLSVVITVVEAFKVPTFSVVTKVLEALK